MAVRAKFEQVAHLLPPGTVPPARPSKYRNRRTVYGGIRYDSVAEADRAATLDNQVAARVVLWWTRQVPFWLGPANIKVIMDFLVVSPLGVRVEDVKGMETPRFRDIRKLWFAHGPVDLWIVKRSGIEVIGPSGKIT
jgi:hypothetical protein